MCRRWGERIERFWLGVFDGVAAFTFLLYFMSMICVIGVFTQVVRQMSSLNQKMGTSLCCGL
jgi:hypothetical protein